MEIKWKTFWEQNFQVRHNIIESSIDKDRKKSLRLMCVAITKEDVRRAMNNLGVPNENEARGKYLEDDCISSLLIFNNEIQYKLWMLVKNLI